MKVFTIFPFVEDRTNKRNKNWTDYFHDFILSASLTVNNFDLV